MGSLAWGRTVLFASGIALFTEQFGGKDHRDVMPLGHCDVGAVILMAFIVPPHTHTHTQHPRYA